MTDSWVQGQRENINVVKINLFGIFEIKSYGEVDSSNLMVNVQFMHLGLNSNIIFGNDILSLSGQIDDNRLYKDFK